MGIYQALKDILGLGLEPKDLTFIQISLRGIVVFIASLAMVRLGKVMSNLMVDVKPTNTKLRDRAVRIVRTLSGADEQSARTALEQCGWVVEKAVQQLDRSSLQKPSA